MSEAGPETVLLLLRHGETAFHEGNRYCGRTDAPLTERGLRQAERLARWAALAGPTVVYSSPLARAVRTAQRAASAARVPHLLDERLTEVDFGRAEGLTSEQMRQRWPRERAAFERDPVGNPLPGGENLAAAAERGTAAVHDMVGRHRGGTVLVVCHSTLLRLVTCTLLGIDLARYRRRFPVVHNTSGAVLAMAEPDRWRLVAFNPRLSADVDGEPGFRLPGQKIR